MLDQYNGYTRRVLRVRQKYQLDTISKERITRNAAGWKQRMATRSQKTTFRPRILPRGNNDRVAKCAGPFPKAGEILRHTPHRHEPTQETQLAQSSHPYLEPIGNPGIRRQGWILLGSVIMNLQKGGRWYTHREIVDTGTDHRR